MIVKCQFCNNKDTDRKEMNFELASNGKTKKYYHKDCWNDYLEHKEFIKDEMVKKDELNEALKNLYGVKEIPNQAWVLLEKLRGGNPVFGAKQQIGKRYREGYEYPLIKETFEYCEDTINYWLGAKNFEGFMGAFKYSLSIVIDKIYYVEQRAKEREQRESMVEKHVEKADNDESYFESNYKKPSKTKSDISDFLDD